MTDLSHLPPPSPGVLPRTGPSASDETLAARAAAGDDTAFAQLFSRYQDRLQGYCRSIVRQDEDAGDALQNTMTKALVALRRHGAGPTAVRPWLYRIAANESITILRRRHPTAELTEQTEPRQDPALDLSGPLLLREELRHTLDGVRRLPQRLQQPLLLRELGGLDYGQVARVTGTTPAAARRAVFEARKLLSTDRDGRDTACAAIRLSLDEGDGRRRRARVVRGHLDSCAACTQWDRARRGGRRQLAFLPADGALGAGLWSWVSGLFGGGAASGVAASGALVVNTKVAVSLSALAIGAVPAALATHDDPTAARAPAQAAVAKTAKASPARSRAAGATRVAAGRTTPALVAAAPVRATRTVGTTATASRTTAVVVSTTTSRPGGARTLAALEAPAGTAPASGRQPQRSGQGHPTHRRPDAAADATAADGAATPRHPGGNGRRDRHRADHPPATTTTTEAEAVATGPVARSGRHAHANAAGVRPGRPHASTAPADPAPADQVPTDPAPTEPGAS